MRCWKHLTAALLLGCAGTLAQAQSSIQLLDPGAQPRAPLRYQYKVGQTGQLEYVMQMEGKMWMDGREMPMPATPAIRTVMTLRVTELSPDGYARIEFNSASAEPTPGAAGAPQTSANTMESLAMLSRLSGSYWINARGMGRQAEVNLRDAAPGAPSPSPAADTVLRMTREFTQEQGAFDAAMFPEEAVGEGARWRVTNRQTIGPIEQVVTQEYTLRARRGNVVELDMQGTTRQSGSASFEGAPAGLQSSGDGDMKGQMRIDLASLVPVMTTESTATSTTTMPAGPGAGEMKSTMTMRHKVAPVTE